MKALRSGYGIRGLFACGSGGGRLFRKGFAGKGEGGGWDVGPVGEGMECLSPMA